MNVFADRFRRVLITILAMACSCEVGLSQDGGDEKPIAPMELTLVPADLSQATASMIKFDRNEDGQIDREEWTRLRWDEDTVRRFDVNRDGKLTHVEMALHHAANRNMDGIEAVDSKYANKMLQRYDTNKNGMLDATEIDAQNWPPDSEEFDKDSDGIITLNEIMQEFAFRRGLRRELGIVSIDTNNANRLIRQHDANLDGKLSEEEATAAGLKVAAEDHNDDRKLDGIEVATVFAKRRMDSGISPTDLYQSQSLFRTLDRDQDGVISGTELGHSRAGGLENADTNQDGQVSELELQSHYAARRKNIGYSQTHLTAARRIILRYDTNSDGVLTEAEYSDIDGDGVSFKAKFSQIDSDADEKLTSEELAKFLASQQGNQAR